MRIDVRELDLGPLSISGVIHTSELGFDPSEIKVLDDIQVNLRAERQLTEVRIRGAFEAQILVPCSRCLEPVPIPIKASFDQFYESNAEHPLWGEIELQERDTEIGFFSGDSIDVSDIVREQILLELPMKPICQEFCKGLCPHCGKNRNLESCNCESLLVDPRLVELLKFKNRMNFDS